MQMISKKAASKSSPGGSAAHAKNKPPFKKTILFVETNVRILVLSYRWITPEEAAVVLNDFQAGRKSKEKLQDTTITITTSIGAAVAQSPVIAVHSSVR